MKLLQNIFAAVIWLALTGSAIAQDHPLLDRMRAFSIAFNAGDARAVASFYALEGILFPPRAAAAVGRDAIAEAYAAGFRAGVRELQFRIVEITPLNTDTLVEIGETVVTINGQKVASRYMHIWQMQDDRWLIVRDIYQVLGEPQP